MNRRYVCMNSWCLAVVCWILFIFFSSTSLAAEWCEALFRWLSEYLFAGLRPASGSYNLLHLLADKGFHVMMFVVLALLLWKAYSSIHRRVWLILLSGLVVGSCSEFLQRFFPGRDPAIRDVLINLGGTALGVCLILLIRRTGHRFAQPLPDHSSVTVSH